MLGTIARSAGFAFNEKNVQAALYDKAAFSDGMLFALATWFEEAPESIVEFTLDRPKFADRKMTDYLMLGMQPLIERLSGEQRLRPQAFFKDERDVDRAVEIIWSDVEVAEGEAPEQPLKTQFPTKESLRFRLPRSQKYYRNMLLEIWRKNYKSIVFVVTPNRNKVGVSGVLPISKATYNDIRDGRRSPYDLGEKDILSESKYQFILIGTLRGDNRNKTSIQDQTKALASTLFIQVALMAEPKLAGLRILTFATTPEDNLRLRQNGFEPLPTMVPEANQPYFEMNSHSPSFPYAIELIRRIQAANR